MKYVIYIMIGMGISAADESMSKEKTFMDRVTMTAMWPAFVSGSAMIVLIKERRKVIAVNGDKT